MSHRTSCVFALLLVAHCAAPTVSPSSDGGDASCLPAGAVCMTGVQCCSGACTNEGRCWSGTRISCTTDASCPSGMICQPCDSLCVYPPTGACDSLAPCPCGYSCINAQCHTNDTTLAAATNCATNADCAINRFCNQAVFECQAPMWLYGSPSGACTTNADCVDGMVCSTMAPAGGDAGADAGAACYANDTATCRDRADCHSSQFNCSQAHQCVRVGC